MLLSKTAIVAVVAALTGQAAAFNAHRHLHNQVGKRVMKTDLVVVWETVYVTAGEESTTLVAASAPEHKHTHTSAIATTTSTTTTVVVPPSSTSSTTTSAKSSAKFDADAVKAAEVSSHSPTTLATALKLAAAEATGEIVDSDLQVPYLGNDGSSDTIPVADPAPSTTIKAAPPATTKAAPATTQPSSGSHTGSGSSSGSHTGSGSSSGSGGSLFSSKRGSAYNDALLANLLGKLSSKTSWAYNWGQTSNGLDSSLSFVPTLWSAGQAGTWDKNVETALKSGSKALFSFNECDNAGQANMSPSEAAASHVKYMNKYSGRAKIGAPSISNSGAPGQGLDWLQSFVDACNSQSEKCAYDFCNIHWYSGVEYADTLFDQIDKASKICNGKPIWLTEFAPTGSPDQIDEFMKTNIPKLDALDTLEAYSYFMTSTGSLFSSSSALSSFGKIYADISL